MNYLGTGGGEKKKPRTTPEIIKEEKHV